MQRTSPEDFKRAVLHVIQPLARGIVTVVSAASATLTGVVPFGGGDRFMTTFPYGFVSAPTPGVVAYFLNLFGSSTGPVILGWYDTNRPSVLPGESIVYNGFGKLIYLATATLRIGSKTASSPVVLGDQLLAYENAVLNAILNAPQIGLAMGSIPVALDPTLRAALVTIQSTYLQSNPSLTNILAQTTFVQRT
jgi:hypothetical protein